MENERDLLEYEKKDVEKKLADQKADSELLRGQLRVCYIMLLSQQSFQHASSDSFSVWFEYIVSVMCIEFLASACCTMLHRGCSAASGSWELWSADCRL